MGIDFFTRLARVAALSFAWAAFGIVLFGVVIWLITKSAPFSVRKEIEEDQNTSLGILMGSVIIGVSLIIAAAVHG